MRRGIGLFQSDPVQDERLKRLAKEIEALAEKDEVLLRRARDIAALRRSAASELHGVCNGFVQAVNRLLARPALELDPVEYRDESFREDLPNLIQINVRGRILQVEFEATPDLVSTEEFRIPYTLSGAVRAFNQALLDKDLIEEQLIFYTVEKDRSMWRFFDARTYRSGALDREYLITLMEQLV
jgi:hypothetical protein